MYFTIRPWNVYLPDKINSNLKNVKSKNVSHLRICHYRLYLRLRRTLETRCWTLTVVCKKGCFRYFSFNTAGINDQESKKKSALDKDYGIFTNTVMKSLFIYKCIPGKQKYNLSRFPTEFRKHTTIDRSKVWR